MIPVSYSYRSLFVRWKTTLMTASGFTLVVAALIVMLAFIDGMQEVCAISGEPENVIVLNEGNADEVLSRLPRGIAAQVETSRGVKRNEIGRPISSREIFMVVSVYNVDISDYEMFSLRGITPLAYDVHTGIKLVSGRAFRPSQSEIIIGKGLQASKGFKLGDSIEIGRKEWTITGVFDAGGSVFESEIWCDLDELASQFKREGVYGAVILRAINPEAAIDLANRLDASKQVNVDAQTEIAYYAKQAEQTKFLQSAAWVIAWFMGIGAIFGVMNTMFAAISQRVKDIAVLRLLGFMPRDILIAFLLEAIFLAAIGGALGGLLGYSVNGLSRSASIGSHDVQFEFRVTWATLLFAGGFSLVMGILGGIFPALSAMRVRPLEAFR